MTFFIWILGKFVVYLWGTLKHKDMESQYIKDLEGNYIEVTDLGAAIDETEKFVGFSDEGSDLHKHWSHILQELKKLNVTVLKNGDTIDA